MFQNTNLKKYWWLVVLLVFNFIYYYFIQHLGAQSSEDLWLNINWFGAIILFVISLLSLGCVKYLKSRIDKRNKQSVQLKYIQILLISFLLFFVITATIQVVIEYFTGQQRGVEYIIGNSLIYIFLHIIVGNAYIGMAYFKETNALSQHLLRTQKAKAESELKVLQQQMDPHFLFNNLNTLASLIPLDTDNAIKFTNKLSKVFRHASQNAKLELITLEEELKFLENYMDLLKFRFGNTFVLKQDLDTINSKSKLIVPMSLQVVIENVTKHNSASKTNPLIIEMNYESDSLIIKNPLRIKKIKHHQTSGIGLKNLADQYQLIANTVISYETSETDFIVKLPLINRIDHEDTYH